MGQAKITTVTFDVGSTLLEARPEIDEMFYRVATSRGHDIAYEDVSCHLDAVNQFYEEEYIKDGDFWCSPEGSVEIFLDMYRYMGHLTGLSHDAEDISQEINKAYHQATSWHIYDDVVPCLKALKQMRLSLGVVSNWSTDLYEILRSLQLAPYFDVVTASAEVGYRKPNPIIFDLTLEKLQSAPGQTIHVGDRADADGVGALEAGVLPVIIDRGEGHAYEAQGMEIAVISSLEALPKLIAERNTLSN